MCLRIIITIISESTSCAGRTQKVWSPLDLHLCLGWSSFFVFSAAVLGHLLPIIILNLFHSTILFLFLTPADRPPNKIHLVNKSLNLTFWETPLLRFVAFLICLSIFCGGWWANAWGVFMLICIIINGKRWGGPRCTCSCARSPVDGDVRRKLCRGRGPRRDLHMWKFVTACTFSILWLRHPRAAQSFYTRGQEGRDVRGFVSGLEPLTAVGLWLHSWDASRCSAVRALQAQGAQWILLTACAALLVSVAECTPVFAASLDPRAVTVSQRKITTQQNKTQL